MDTEELWQQIMGIRDDALLRELELSTSVWKVKSREMIIEENMVLSDFIFMGTGLVKATSQGNGRNRCVMAFSYLPGDPVSPIYDLKEPQRSYCRVETIEDSTMFCIPISKLNELVETNLEAALFYSSMLGISLQNMIEMNQILALGTGKERYQWFLNTYPGLIERVSKKDIAAFLNMSPENLSRIRKTIPEDQR